MEKTFFRLVLFLIFSLFCGVIYGQNKTITGKVTDENGIPLKGASIFVRGTPAIGTTSGDLGKFELNLPSGSKTLVFSFVGKLSKEINIENRNTVDVTLQD
ncbi:MAG TPA: carboxypeptidase-like regulatory domain-containing protein, partial [Hanamia sp.]|nr:carboxypeptidase-like regulatory domain-containing protein [Hanamia sp.]